MNNWLLTWSSSSLDVPSIRSNLYVGSFNKSCKVLNGGDASDTVNDDVSCEV